MSKKKSADEAGGESGKSKKKPAAKKPAAKKVEKSTDKAADKKAAPKRARSKTIESAPIAQTIVEAIEAAAEAQPQLAPEPSVDEDEIEDAEIVETAPELSDEEKELSAIYGDDLAKPATAHAEFADRQTADEDRPMMPEINAREERKHRWEDRRNERRRRRDERQGRRDGGGGNNGGGGGGGPRPQDGNQQQAQRPNEHRQGDHRQPHHNDQRPPVQIQMPPAPTGDAAEGPSRVGTPLGDAAAAVFAQLRNGQPLPVRQLAAMMRKRSLVNQDPEQLWPQLKAELLGDERSYRALGLRPRIVYRGRDLFAPGPVAMSTTADAEAGVATALSRLAGATHRALGVRLAKASPAGFERIIHAYLVAAGYREIAWVKRVGGISYASATAPGLGRTVLISARSGDAPIDRRGIGELRVGVEAKNLVAGILFAPSDVSEDAERELERAGRSISVVCGEQLVAALIQVGVGVVSAAAPIHYVDDQLLEELLAG